MAFDFHEAFQVLMQDKGDVLSGYHVIHGEPESQAHIRVDYACQLDLSRPYQGPETGLRPLAHLKPFNMIELESKSLNDMRFRYHFGRALVMENPHGKRSRRGKLGLTILVVQKPQKLLKSPEYQFQQIAPWHFRVEPAKDLMVDIIVLRRLQKVDGGEAAALLQLLEPNQERRRAIWSKILQQNLTGREQVKNVMIKLDEEVFMTVAEEFRLEGQRIGEQIGQQIGHRLGHREGQEQLLARMVLDGADDAYVMRIGDITMEQLAALKEKLHNQ